MSGSMKTMPMAAILMFVALALVYVLYPTTVETMMGISAPAPVYGMELPTDRGRHWGGILVHGVAIGAFSVAGCLVMYRFSQRFRRRTIAQLVAAGGIALALAVETSLRIGRGEGSWLRIGVLIGAAVATPFAWYLWVRKRPRGRSLAG